MPSRTPLNRTGKRITTYVVFDIQRRIATVLPGETIEVVTDDYEPIENDIAAWCDATGHRLLSSAVERRGRRFLIEKGYPKPVDKSFAMVISADGLEELRRVNREREQAGEDRGLHELGQSLHPGSLVHRRRRRRVKSPL